MELFSKKRVVAHRGCRGSLPATIAAGLVVFAATAQASPIAQWTFESTAPTTAGPFTPEVGAGAASGFHAGSSTYSSPAGNGSTHSFSSTNWAVGDYYQFQVSTTGASGLEFIWDQTSSSTGPGNYELEYSLTGLAASWVNIEAYNVVPNAAPNPTWSSNPANYASIYTNTENLSAISAINNEPTVFFRLVDLTTTSAGGGTVGTSGTDRVDNVIVQVVPTPEPSSVVLATLGVVGVAAVAIRRRQRRDPAVARLTAAR